jgi:uncharacterized protein (TIGR03000 family)
MYSIVLMAAMTSTTEAPSFGDVWAKHCFWECCLPARYGWVACGPGYSAYYPASYTSCYGYGCGCGGCYSSCYGCYGGCWGSCYGGCGGWHHACYGGYYNCYGGGGWAAPWAGVGYSGFGAYGNFGNYNTIPVYAAPVYAAPGMDGRPIETKPIDNPPAQAKPIIEIKPSRIEPLKTMAAPAKASVVVRVPQNAKVYIDGNLMHSNSTERKFTSPAIEAGESFYYTIRVVVEKDGKEVEDVRRVPVKAGEVSHLAFDNLFDRVRPAERTIVDANRSPIK